MTAPACGALGLSAFWWGAALGFLAMIVIGLAAVCVFAAIAQRAVRQDDFGLCRQGRARGRRP